MSTPLFALLDEHTGPLLTLLEKGQNKIDAPSVPDGEFRQGVGISKCCTAQIFPLAGNPTYFRCEGCRRLV